VPALRESVGVPLIVFSRQDEDAAAINSLLREAGCPVHCTRVGQLSELEETLQHQTPELLIVFDEDQSIDLTVVADRLSRLNPSPPLLLARAEVTEQSIADAMNCGARDVVSLTHRNRFQSVVDRELQAYRLRTALGGVLTSAHQYREELKALMQDSTEAIAYVQEGIIVSANQIWARLFGYQEARELADIPIMDVCDEVDRPMLKGALIACLRGKWDDSSLQVKGRRVDGTIISLQVDLDRVPIDGDLAVRVVVPGNQGRERSPTELLQQSPIRDPSTGFYHRHFLLEKLAERIDMPLEDGVRAIAYVRPDNFSRVHDDIGVLATEKLLAQMAALLKNFMHQSDLYGRFGGTMFVALLERGTMTDIEAWANQIRLAIADHVFEAGQQSTSLTCTIGLSGVDPDQLALPRLFSNIEQAWRLGREAGGNRVQLTADVSETQVIRQIDTLWIPRIRAALMQNRLRLLHQPITGLNEEIEATLDTGVLMLDEDGNDIPAIEFIPVAERAGMIKSIDRWVIGATFSFCAKNEPSLVFVRLSGDSITDETLCEWLTARLKLAQIKPSRVCFQVSEAVANQHLRQTKAFADQLHKMGFRFAIDHTGKGRDLDQLLKHVPMEYIKMDGSLMQGLHHDPEMQAIVAHIASLANQFDIKTIAERVEDAQTMAVLWQLGISFIQGNYLQSHDLILEDTQTMRGLAVR
jgi:diguanylate cyclase (GGDEF)-like protein/PAS domain S-box-containing protein